ncbi:MAG: hypothetical protein KC729_11200, partial [Candidatus Eisenbacteria bacterium]|nr:hypothetical protein [Candidatus Eisenbacteria bacterium]
MNRRLLTLAFYCVAATFAVPTARADWNPIQAEIYAGYLSAMGVAPTNPDRIYVGTTANGFYRTDDAGLHWLDIAGALPPGQRIGSIAVSPTDPDVVLAGSGALSPVSVSIYRSTDGGDHWAPISAGLNMGSVSRILFDPLDDAVVFAAVSGTGKGVYRSSDGGVTWDWSTAAFGSQTIYDLALDPADPDRVIALASGKYYRSVDSGATWQTITESGNLGRLSWSVANPDLVWAVGTNASSDDRLFQSLDGGLTFSERPLPAGDAGYFRAVAGDPVDPDRVIVSGLHSCGGFDGGAAWRTTNQGSSWSLIFSPSTCSERAFDITYDAFDPSRLYFATPGVEGFWVSLNNGSTWTSRKEGLHSYSVDLVRSDGLGTTYARGYFTNLIANDPTGSWLEIPQSEEYELWGFDLNRSTSGLIYQVGQVFFGDFGRPLANTSADFGFNWSPLPGELPIGVEGWPLQVASAANDHRVYVFGNASVYRSDDQGESYVEVNSTRTLDVAAVDPSNQDRILGAGTSGASLWLSTDAGATWNPSNSGLPPGAVVYIEYDPADSDHVLVAVNHAGAFESTDGGAGWAPFLSYTGQILDAAWDPALAHIYLATQDDGVVSNDPGLGSYGLNATRVASVAYDAPSRTLLAGTTNGAYVTALLDPADVREDETGAPSLVSVEVAPVPARTEVAIALRRAESTGAGAVR